jgi:hypothetical protein
MKFLVRDICVEEAVRDPVGNSEEDNIIEDLEDIALERVANAPLNKIIKLYNESKVSET